MSSPCIIYHIFTSVLTSSPESNMLPIRYFLENFFKIILERKRAYEGSNFKSANITESLDIPVLKLRPYCGMAKISVDSEYYISA